MEKRCKLGWKEKREAVRAGKEPKEPLESTKEMGQREKGRDKPKTGEEPVKEEK